MVKAIILAAGEGTRLRPITETRPKALIPVLCKPLIDWHVDALLRAGVEEIYIVVSYLKDQIIEHFANLGSISSKIVFIDQGEPRGTGDAIIKAAEKIGYGVDVIITYVDLFLEDFDIYRDIVSRDEYIVLGARVNDPRNYGVLITQGDLLVKVIEKPDYPVSNLVNAGIYKLNTSDILENRDIPLSPRGEIEATDLLDRIASKKRIKVLAYEKTWMDIGKPWHVIDANKLALERITSQVRGRIHDPVVIKEPVFIDVDSVIYPYTTIEGPVYIGRRVEIGPNSFIRPYSVICDGSKIGFSVEVKESVIFESVHAHHLAYIGDSVICENVNLGAGTILANLRHDNRTVKMNIKGKLEDTGRRKLGAVIGANVKTGVNTSIMPGVKIGSNSWILPGSVVYRDVEKNTIYPPKIDNKHGE